MIDCVSVHGSVSVDVTEGLLTKFGSDIDEISHMHEKEHVVCGGDSLAVFRNTMPDEPNGDYVTSVCCTLCSY